MTKAAPTSDLRGYLPTLDGWRAIAILLVLFVHSRDALIRVFGAPMARIASHTLLLGQYGVDLFFAISGLLITSRLLAEEAKTGRISLKSFYIRRAFRILPPSLTYLAVIALLGTAGLIAFRLDSWCAALLFYVNYTTEPLWYVGHFWSLAVEEHFYAFWPALLVFAAPRRRFPIAVALCSATTLWRLLNYKLAAIGTAMHSPYFSHQGRTDFQLDGILWGAAFALAFNRFGQSSALRRALTPRLGALLLVSIVASLFVNGDWKLIQALLIFRHIATPVVLLTTILNSRGLIAAVFENSALRYVGRLSYSLYLWQQLFLVWGVNMLPHVPIAQRFPFNLVCAFACALASYYLIEKPFIRIGHRVAATIASPTAAAIVQPAASPLEA